MNVTGLTTTLIPQAPQLAAPAIEAPGSIGSGSAAGGTSFKDIMSAAINQVESSQNSATDSVNKFLAGDGEDLHSVALATQRADLEFQMFMQVRNKVISAYQEVMKMQL